MLIAKPTYISTGPALMHPNQRARIHQQKRVKDCAKISDSFAFFNLLTGPDFLDQVESLLPEHRERQFPPTETLSLFLAQTMSTDKSCQKAVDSAAIKRLLSGLPANSTHTGGYCRARQRLPLEMISTLTRYTGQMMAKTTPSGWHWKGRPIRLVDGATATLPDTEANQKAYPQPSSQKPGLGFPLCRMVSIVCLASGAVLDANIGPCKGKGSDEQALLRPMLNTLKVGDILLGDAYYATYFLLCSLIENGIDGVFEQQGARRRVTDFRKGERLGPKDHLIEINKPKIKPSWMSQNEYDHAPEILKVRELKTGGKVLVTTLLSPKSTTKTALKELYQDRWHIELDLRNIKTTLGMEMLTCRTPDMVEKEIWVYLLAYNLIRLLMAQAALLANLIPRQISFKHTLQLWSAWQQNSAEMHRYHELTGLFILIAQQRVGGRPGRIEPRAIKQRPKPYKLLTEPRGIVQAKIRVNGHPKKLK